MPDKNDTSEQPVTFDAESSKHSRLDSSAFRGRVPVVLAFVGVHGPNADAAIISLDSALLRFGERRIQLLVVVDGYPSEVAKRLGVAVPLITDDGLRDELDARVEDGRTSSVILGNDGRVLEVVRHLPADDCASAILLVVERLTAEFPGRFSVLPEFDEDTTELADPNGDMSTFTGPSFRQRLSWLTGDRDREAKALADSIEPNHTANETVLAAAAQAVSDAHGDAHVEESDPLTSDVATPDDVVKQMQA